MKPVSQKWLKCSPFPYLFFLIEISPLLLPSWKLIHRHPFLPSPPSLSASFGQNNTVFPSPPPPLSFYPKRIKKELDWINGSSLFYWIFKKHRPYFIVQPLHTSLPYSLIKKTHGPDKGKNQQNYRNISFVFIELLKLKICSVKEMILLRC